MSEGGSLDQIGRVGYSASSNFTVTYQGADNDGSSILQVVK
jgi:hypothetical protein